jgi:drug/metabolite transporter (DMT)-like permease
MPHLGEFAALLTALFWTVTAMAFEAAGRRIGSIAVNLIRLVLAFGVLVLFCTLARGRPLPTDAPAAAWLFLSLSGLAGFTIGDLALFQAFVLIGSRTALLMMSMVPLLTALGGWVFLGEELSRYDALGMGLTLLGVVWVVAERRADENGLARRLPVRGVLLSLVAAVGQAMGLILAKHGMGDYNPFAATQIRALAGIVGFVIIFSVAGWWPRVRAGLRDRAAMWRVSLGAFFGPFLGVSFSLLAIQHTQTGVAATIMAITPITIIPPAILIFKEKVSPRAIGGALLAVAGVGILFAW